MFYSSCKKGAQMTEQNGPQADMDSIRGKLDKGEALTQEELAAYTAAAGKRRDADARTSGPSSSSAGPAIVPAKRRSRLWPAAVLLGGGAFIAYLYAAGEDKRPDPAPAATGGAVSNEAAAPAEPAPEDGWENAPVNYIVQKHVRLNREADAGADSGYYAQAGSCVYAAADTVRKNGFLFVDGYDSGLPGGTRGGYVPVDALGAGRKAQPGELCEAMLVAAGKDTPLPAQPAQEYAHKPVPAQPQGPFRIARFYTVYGESNIRENPVRSDQARARIQDGSCVSQSTAKNVRGEFVHVTAMYENGNKFVSGWMLTGALRPAPAGTTENSCHASVLPPQP